MEVMPTIWTKTTTTAQTRQMVATPSTKLVISTA